MIMTRTTFSALLAAATLGAAALLAPTGASAQLFWDWGGDESVGGAGREVVRFASAAKPGEVIVSFGDRRVYFITQPGQALSYPIAIPREQDRWAGTTSVTMKRENPSWTPTSHMRAENPRLPSWVPGGHPMNPLGIRAMYLGSSTYRIHGTDAPWTIGTAVSKGCIRMYNQDVLDLYPRVKVGAKVTVTWQRYQGGYASSGPSERQAAPTQRKPAPTYRRAAARTGTTRSASTTE